MQQKILQDYYSSRLLIKTIRNQENKKTGEYLLKDNIQLKMANSVKRICFFNFLILVTFLVSNVLRNFFAVVEDPSITAKMSCRELAQFTPQLCDNLMAGQECKDICREGKTTTGKNF